MCSPTRYDTYVGSLDYSFPHEQFRVEIETHHVAHFGGPAELRSMYLFTPDSSFRSGQLENDMHGKQRSHT